VEAHLCCTGGQVAILCTASPAESEAEATLSTLRFAMRARRVRVLRASFVKLSATQICV
jgi:hypothetical protein